MEFRTVSRKHSYKIPICDRPLVYKKDATSFGCANRKRNISSYNNNLLVISVHSFIISFIAHTQRLQLKVQKDCSCNKVICVAKSL